MKRYLGTKGSLTILFAGLLGLAMPIVSKWEFQSKKVNHRPLGTVKKQEFIQQVTLTGTVTPLRKSIISAPYDGYVKKLFVHTRQQVKAGDPIVSITQSLSSPDEDTFPLRAPFSGTVVQVLKAEGEYLEQGNRDKNAIVRIDDLSKLFINVDVPESEIPKLKEGQKGIIKITAVSEKIYEGYVRDTAVAALEKTAISNSNARSEFTVRIEIINSDDLIKPGMTALVDVVTERLPNTLVLPIEFLREHNGTNFVVMADGTKRNVQIGVSNEDFVEIVNGLKEGDRVRLADLMSLANEK